MPSFWNLFETSAVLTLNGQKKKLHLNSGKKNPDWIFHAFVGVPHKCK